MREGLELMYSITALKKGVSPTGKDNIAYIDALYSSGLIGYYCYPNGKNIAMLNEFVIPKTAVGLKDLKRRVRDIQKAAILDDVKS